MLIYPKNMCKISILHMDKPCPFQGLPKASEAESESTGPAAKDMGKGRASVTQTKAWMISVVLSLGLLAGLVLALSRAPGRHAMTLPGLAHAEDHGSDHHGAEAHEVGGHEDEGHGASSDHQPSEAVPDSNHHEGSGHKVEAKTEASHSSHDAHPAAAKETHDAERHDEHGHGGAVAAESCPDGGSPIAIESGHAPEKAGTLAFHYEPADSEVTSRDGVLTAYDRSSNSVVVDDRHYKLGEVRVRAPAEHQLNGEAYAAEIQLFHRNEDGQALAVAVMVQAGAENEHLEWARLWKQFHQADERNEPSDSALVDASGLLPKSKAHYRYSGTMTLPPCSPVQWLVMAQPLRVKDDQVAVLKERLEHKPRPLQKLGDRVVSWVPVGGEGPVAH